MPCRCTADNLRLFVRSIGHVGLPTSTAFTASRRFSIPSFRLATPSARSPLRRAHSTAIFSEHDSLSDRRTEPESPSKRRLGNDGENQSTTFDTDSAVVDFSPDAIDALAAELATQQPVQEYEASSEAYETPLKSLLKDLPLKKPKPPTALVSKTTFRRTQVVNDSFALNFTSPRRTAPDSQIGNISASKSTRRDEWTPPARDHWQIDKEALAKKFPDGWSPRKRLSPDAIVGIRALHAQMPQQYTTQALSQEFGVTVEAIRRILKSKWTPSTEEETDRQRRWFKRGQQIWSRYADLGVKPPRPWRGLGIGQGKPEWLKKKQEWAKRQQEPNPLPALVTTVRRREARATSEAVTKSASLADRIL